MSYPFSNIQEFDVSTNADPGIIYTASERVMVTVQPRNLQALNSWVLVEAGLIGVNRFVIFGSAFQYGAVSSGDPRISGMAILDATQRLVIRVPGSSNANFRIIVLSLPRLV